jgi:SPP1 family predicted phage head-tail adaptor
MPSTDILTAADIEEFRFLVKDLSFPDTYEVERPVEGSLDDMGQGTTTTATVEVGMCGLRAGGLRPQEQVIADQLGWAVAYSVDLPMETILTPADRIRINGRRFEVGGVVDEGRWAMNKSAVIQEQST